MRASAGRLTAVWLLSVTWVLLSCVPALAHASLVTSSPSAGSESYRPPERVELRFSEPVDAEFDPVVVRNSDGTRVDDGDARVDPQDARVVLAPLKQLPEGSYDVEWRVTSIDGHVVEGRYGFAVTGADQPAGEKQGAAGKGTEGKGAEGPNAEERPRQAERDPAAQDSGSDRSAPILVYGALSLVVAAVVVAAAILLTRLAHRPKP
jgi:methionine-rich copper-binding protein CopC